MNLPIHTRPVYKWLVWRFHQAIIPFPWISYISEWQIDKNLAPQGWWGDPLSLSDRHFSSQEGVKWADPAYEWIKTSFSKGSQVTDRQQRRERRGRTCAMQCISMHQHHYPSLIGSALSSQQYSTLAPKVHGSMVVMQGWGISTQWSSVKIWYCIITASRRGSQQVRRHARPQAAAWFRTQPLSWPRAHQQSIHTISNQH